jgi:hypothetical protein
MRWTPTLANRAYEGTLRQVSPTICFTVVCYVSVNKFSHSNAVKILLINRLRCANCLKFGRSICGANQNGNLSVMCFNYCGMKLDGGSSRCAQQNRWHTRCFADT